jgi:uncharacterized protein YjiS (DUF1127 family)
VARIYRFSESKAMAKLHSILSLETVMEFSPSNCAACLPAQPNPAPSRIVATWKRLWQGFLRRQRHHDEQRVLAAMSDRTLYDLGLAERAPPWRLDNRHWDLDRWSR